MRSMFAAFGFLILLSASANAAALHHQGSRHAVHRSEDMMRRFNRSHDTMPGFAGPTRAGKAIWPPVLEDQTPSYDDPSKFGGG